MNHSIYSADRATHSKIVFVAVLLAVLVSGAAVALHIHSGTAPVERTAVFKPGKPMVFGDSTIVTAR